MNTNFHQIDDNQDLSADAYWVRGENYLPVYQRHINEIIKRPQLFGFTKEQVEKIHSDEKEPLYHEGRARNKLMSKAFESGWIRLRKKTERGCEYWIIQAGQKEQAFPVIKDFISFAVKNELIRPDEDLLLTFTNADPMRFSYAEGGAAVLINA